MVYPFEDLKVWQKSMELAKEVYQITRNFPEHEKYGLVTQMRRATISIPLNIAEGRGRYHKKSFVQFLMQARGSLYEMVTLVKLSTSLGYLKSETMEDLLEKCNNISRMLSGLINSMKKPRDMDISS